MKISNYGLPHVSIKTDLPLIVALSGHREADLGLPTRNSLLLQCLIDKADRKKIIFLVFL